MLYVVRCNYIVQLLYKVHKDRVEKTLSARHLPGSSIPVVRERNSILANLLIDRNNEEIEGTLITCVPLNYFFPDPLPLIDQQVSCFWKGSRDGGCCRREASWSTDTTPSRSPGPPFGSKILLYATPSVDRRGRRQECTLYGVRTFVRSLTKHKRQPV